MAAKNILLPTLKIILKAPYPLPVKKQPPIPPSSDIPPSPSPLPSTEHGSLSDDQIESEEHCLEAWAYDDMTGKHGKMEPKRTCSTFKLSLQRAGAGLEAPGRLHLSSREMQRTAVDGCAHTNGSSKLGEIIFFQAVVGMKTDKPTQLNAFGEIVILPMDLQQNGEVNIGNGENKQVDPDGRWGDAPHAKQRLY